jgi:hypothetical protein
MPESSPLSRATWYRIRPMSYSRALSAALLAAATSFSLVTGSGCGTAALGIEDCRDIEEARCHAAVTCGIISDADACERYYRDHCLHGLPVKPPAGDSVPSCVEVIKAAGRCAKGDPSIELAACDPAVATPKTGFTRACDVVSHPERTPECAFLSELPEEEDPGSAGAGGTAGQGGAQDE